MGGIRSVHGSGHVFTSGSYARNCVLDSFKGVELKLRSSAKLFLGVKVEVSVDLPKHIGCSPISGEAKILKDRKIAGADNQRTVRFEEGVICKHKILEELQDVLDDKDLIAAMQLQGNYKMDADEISPLERAAGKTS